MRRFITPLFFIGFWTSLIAGPAEPVVMDYTQPNGTVVHYYLHGDEHLNWMTDLSGKVIEIGSDGYVRPGMMPSEEAFRSAHSFRAETTARPFRIQSSGTRRFIVVLVDYPDLAFSKTAENFNQYFNGNGAGSTGSVNEYFQDQSDGNFNPVFDIYGPVTLVNNRASYKDSPLEALKEAIGILVNDGTLNLSDYISSSSGIFKYVEDVVMIFAGHSQASGDPDGIWPCSQSATVYKVNDRLTVYGYCCGPELQGASGDSMAGIGHLCHEFGHRMGLPDFYDTKRSDHGDNVAEGCLDYSVMGHGSYNNYSKTPPPLSMVEKSICGWAQLENIPSITSSQNITLHEIGQGADKTRAFSIPTDKEGEVFLCEYRCKNAGSFTLKLSPGSEGNATVSSWYLDGALVESTEPRPRITLTAGTHVIEAVLSTGKKLRLEVTAQ